MSYVDHLSKDKKLKKLIELHGPQILEGRKNIFHMLCASIMSQQLSTKVAAVIHKRFMDLFNGKEPTPEQVLKLEHVQLRSIGLSNSKVTYIQNVARFAIEKGMDHRKLNKMESDEIVDYLTEIKGVGRWTVEMLLMFTLGREDIFSEGDLGIQNAMEKLYQLEITDKKIFKEKILHLSKSWSPFRTYACIHLWRWKDDVKSKITKPGRKKGK